MKTIQTHARYVEWLSADEMHNESKEWLSQLEFVKDEHLFFEDLIKSYTLQLIKPEKFAHNKEIIDAINKSQKQNSYLIKAIIVHESKLQILVDGINQPKEETLYRKEHKALINRINDHFKHYQSLKTQLFDIVKKIKKEEKIGLLIDKR